MSTQLKNLSLGRFAKTFSLALALLVAAQGHAQQNNQPSERAAADLQKIQPLLEAQNWNGIVNLMRDVLRYAAPNSYDQALASDILSKAYLQLSDYGKSIQPLEQAYLLGDTYKYFDEKSQIERLYLMAQLFYQEASAVKVKATQEEYFNKASRYIETWITRQTEPSQDGRLFYVSLLYNRAVMDPQNVNKPLLKKAQDECYEALNTELFPKEGFYLILLATLQQQGDLKKTGELLELLAKQYPSKSSYWLQLFGVYSNLAVETKNPDEALDYNLRAIITIERAQALGFMNTPKDNYNLVGIYFNIGQFGKATELLHAGLLNGAIEPDIKKWELLAFSFIQINKEFKAIEVLKEATKVFPNTGQLDNQVAQIFYSLNESEQAYHYLNSALAKGNLDNPGAVYYFKAYICFELQKFDEALVAINKAAELQGSDNKQLPSLRAAIEESIKARAAALQGTSE